MREIVEKNLERMTADREGGMPRLIRFESMGGNAGAWNGLSCVAANFVYDDITGKIFYFTNKDYEVIPRMLKIPEIARNVVGNLVQGTYRIAISFVQRPGKRVVDLIPHCNTTDHARKVLEETIKLYNEKYGFSAA